MNIINKILGSMSSVLDTAKEYWFPTILIVLLFLTMLFDSCTIANYKKDFESCKNKCMPSQFEIINNSCWCYGEDSNSLNRIEND